MNEHGELTEFDFVNELSTILIKNKGVQSTEENRYKLKTELYLLMKRYKNERILRDDIDFDIEGIECITINFVDKNNRRITNAHNIFRKYSSDLRKLTRETFIEDYENIMHGIQSTINGTGETNKNLIKNHLSNLLNKYKLSGVVKSDIRFMIHDTMNDEGDIKSSIVVDFIDGRYIKIEYIDNIFI